MKINLPSKKWFILGIVVLLSFFAFSWWNNAQETKKKEAAKYKLVSVQRSSLREVVAANGRVIPKYEVEIKAKASGRIVKLSYDISDKVKAGELLAELDPVDETRQVNQASAQLSSLESKYKQAKYNVQVSQLNLKTEIDKAKASLASTKAKLLETEAKLKRENKLLEGDFISKEEYQATQTLYAAAQTEFQNAQIRFQELKTQEVSLSAQEQQAESARADANANRAALLTAEQRLSETKIYSPIDGVLSSRAVQIGQIVASGVNNVSGGTTLMTVADLSDILTIASVDESDIGKIQLGQMAQITVDAFPNELFQGKVVQIATKGINEANVVTFEVKIEVLGEGKHKLKPEMTTNIEIIISEKTNALTLPIEAVLKQNNREYVLQKNAKASTPLKVLIQTGINNGEKVEIVSGLEEGEIVLIKNKVATDARWSKGNKGNGTANTQGMRMMGKK